MSYSRLETRAADTTHTLIEHHPWVIQGRPKDTLHRFIEMTRKTHFVRKGGGAISGPTLFTDLCDYMKHLLHVCHRTTQRLTSWVVYMKVKCRLVDSKPHPPCPIHEFGHVVYMPWTPKRQFMDSMVGVLIAARKAIHEF